MIRPAGADRDEQNSVLAAANADLTAVRHEFYFQLPNCLQARLQPLLQDERDLPILYLFFNVSATVLPAALATFALPAWSKVFGPLYFAVTYTLYLERFLLALHYSQHRKLFKSGSFACSVQPSICSLQLLQHKAHAVTDLGCLSAGCNYLNWIAPMLLSPLFGVPSGLYRFHHCVMHHSVRCRAVLNPLMCLCDCQTKIVSANLSVTLMQQCYVFHIQESNWYPKDLSSTEPYQRDHLPHFLM